MSSPTTYDKVKAVFDRYGVPEYVWYPIALAESNLNPNAVGDNGASIGIFQINRVQGQGIGYTVDQLKDPTTNAEIAARAIVGAYQSLQGQVPPSQIAAEVARRSGHPGGSISNPFPATDSRIQRIQSLAQSFVDKLGFALTFPRTQSVLNQGTQAVQQQVSQDLTAAIDTAIAPIKPIGEAAKELTDRFNQIGAAGFLFGIGGLILVFVTLAGAFAESNAGKAAGGAAKAGAGLAIKAAAA